MALADAVTLVLTSPAGPVEPPEIGFYDSPDDLLGVRVCALAASDVALQPVSGIKFGQRALDLLFRLRDGAIGICNSHVVAGIAQSMTTHLRVSICIAEQDSDVDRSECIESLVSVRVAGEDLVARVLVPPGTWRQASVATVQAVSWADVPMTAPSLPARVMLHASHERAPPGRAHDRASDGDCAGLLAALAAGGSTEEVDEVGAIAAWFCVPFLNTSVVGCRRR